MRSLLVTNGCDLAARLRSRERTVKRRKKIPGGEEQSIGSRGLAPDHPLLVQQIIDHFDAIAHLRLRPLGHGNHRSADLAGLDVIKRGDAFRPAFFQLLFVACHARPSYDLPSTTYQLPAILTPAN